MKKIFNTKTLIIIIGGILLFIGLIIYSLKDENKISNDIVSLETTTSTSSNKELEKDRKNQLTKNNL